jgi:hypothetical protein
MEVARSGEPAAGVAHSSLGLVVVGDVEVETDPAAHFSTWPTFRFENVYVGARLPFGRRRLQVQGASRPRSALVGTPHQFLFPFPIVHAERIMALRPNWIGPVDYLHTCARARATRSSTLTEPKHVSCVVK